MFLLLCVCSEISRLDLGLIVEVWNKGLIWDTMVGTVWIPLRSIRQSEEDYSLCWGSFSFISQTSYARLFSIHWGGQNSPYLYTRPLSWIPTFIFSLSDIPEEEAQYWTSKLEQINAMRDHDEVGTESKYRPYSAPSKLEQINTIPVGSSRYNSSGNLSQGSSQLSELDQESVPGSEPEERRDRESFHSYHSTGSCKPNGTDWEEEEEEEARVQVVSGTE
ncbi:UNVERIFIED_CONTAM: hypothetical protein FKN15_004180 [Acipenser sinensis]